MGIITFLAFICIVFVLAWHFRETALGVLPFAVCAVGLVLYALAFVRFMSFIDWILIAGGAFSVYVIIKKVRKNGKSELVSELKRIFLDSHLWAALLVIAVMCLLLRGEQILEWDGYNFWGPDTKSLFYHDGFAPLYSNAASSYGDYPPFSQLIFWWASHLAGEFSEQNMFYAYYIFGALLMFSIADRFRMKKGAGKYVMSFVACIAAVVLPGVACTAWYRALCVDPLMAMIFGVVISLIVTREGAHDGFWKVKIVICLMSLTLVKSIGFLWSALALVLFCLWWLKEKKEFKFALVCLAGILVSYFSWSIFCQVMDRATYLSSNLTNQLSLRLTELKNGEFLSSGNTWGYLTSYARAFLITPIHREWTFAIDLTPAALILIMFVAVIFLWKFGFIPKKKIGRLIVYMVLTFGIIYAVMIVGQMTMFYHETQYLEPVKAVTLMTRYCAPANMGLLILIISFASGKATGEGQEPVLPETRKGLVAAVLAGALALSAGAYDEMAQRFIHDPLDESRIQLRAKFTTLYSEFLTQIEAVPWEEANSRVLLCVYETETNPIVINAASPVSFLRTNLRGDSDDLLRIMNALQAGHERFLYVKDCTEELAAVLSDHVADGEFEVETLYEILSTEELTLARVN